jgi:hypothetical protein
MVAKKIYGEEEKEKVVLHNTALNENRREYFAHMYVHSTMPKCTPPELWLHLFSDSRQIEK